MLHANVAFTLAVVITALATPATSFSPMTSKAKRTGTLVKPLSMTIDFQNEVQSSIFTRRNLMTSSLLLATVSQMSSPKAANARLDPVNRPDLLPKESGLNVIQVEKFLTGGQERRMNDILAALERDTGFRVRVLCQAYPQTPGLAIRDYWDLGKEGQKDDKYIVLVVDQFGGKGNSLNFNVGEGVKFALPNIFWTRLQSKYGSTFFVKENGIDLAIVNAIEAVVSCLRSEDQFCVNVPDEGLSLKSLGMK